MIITGSYRRGKKQMGDIDILLTIAVHPIIIPQLKVNPKKN